MARLTGERLRQQLAAGQPGPEGSAHEARLRPAQPGDLRPRGGAARRGGAALRRLDACAGPSSVDFTGRDAGYRYLRAKGNSIEGGTSEILRNIVAERVLGLPVRAPRRQGRAPGRTCPDDATSSRRAVTCSTPRSRRRCAARRARTCSPTACRAGRACSRPYDGEREPYDPELWRTLAGGHRARRPAGAGGARRRGRVGARGRGGAGGAGPGGRAGAVPDQRGARHRRRCSAGRRPDELLAGARRGRAHRGAGGAAVRRRPAAAGDRRPSTDGRVLNGRDPAVAGRGGRRRAAGARRRRRCTRCGAADVRVARGDLARPDPAARRRHVRGAPAGGARRRVRPCGGR